MIVDLQQLRAEQGAALVVTYHETIASQIAEAPFTGPVDGEFTLTNLGAVLKVSGWVRTQVELQCDRCARPFSLALVADVDEELAWAEDDPVLVVAGGTLGLDLSGLAREELVLALPMVAHCDEACEGICERCGADRRGGRCRCPDDPEDRRLHPLARLRVLLDGDAGILG
ncbi:MAG: DUF177 domain-containing protein [Armatimonadota bacterium]|nr:DUF177 domain-containing protein [Armatimonadota bacterium]MDR7532403.1 DUF177 domain-containing protein [Armatimonadota bacterium]MDR7535330.1 DUF177 domain-containing protein [Armatimonadota bacterium]